MLGTVETCLKTGFGLVFPILAMYLNIKSLPEAGFGNMAPYQWAGSTDIDFAADEVGLWVSFPSPYKPIGLSHS